MPRKKADQHETVPPLEKPPTARLEVEGTDDSEETVPGAVPYLTQLLHEEIAQQRASVESLADAMHVTPPYIRSLLNGNRHWGGLGRDKLRALADVLGIKPYITVFLMAGVVQPEDLIDGSLHDVLRAQYDVMRKDPSVGYLLPPKTALQTMPIEYRRLIVMMWLEILKLRTLAAKEKVARRRALRDEDLKGDELPGPLEF